MNKFRLKMVGWYLIKGVLEPLISFKIKRE